MSKQPASAEGLGSDNIIERCQITYLYLSQGDKWMPNGRPTVAIGDMDEGWRRNAARWLEKRAVMLAGLYTFGEVSHTWGASAPEVLGEINGEPVYGRMVSLAPQEGSLAADALERELDQAAAKRHADPVSWVRTTKLHRALLAGMEDEVPQMSDRQCCREDAGDCICSLIRQSCTCYCRGCSCRGH